LGDASVERERPGWRSKPATESNLNYEREILRHLPRTQVRGDGPRAA